MGFFNRKRAPQWTARAHVHLNARLQPVHRGDVYEDPLDKVLAKRAPGSKVDGGGTEFTPEDGPLSCDTELVLTGDPEQTLRIVIDALENLGAPAGSWASLDDGPRIPFGVTHGFALILDGTSLPDEVYAHNDVNELASTMVTELGNDGELQSWWEGPENTALYFYGRDPERVKTVLTSAATRFPLAQGSEVVLITD